MSSRYDCQKHYRELSTWVSMLVVAVFALGFPTWCLAGYTGRVVDESTGVPLADAIVTLGDLAVRTSKDGAFEIEGPGDSIAFRAYGYRRESLPAAEFKAGGHDVALTAFRPKALYLSYFGVGSARLRQSALSVIKRAHLNALVIDVKGDRGLLAYRSSIALTQEVGAQRSTTIPDPKSLLDSLHRQGLYVVARIVVFKDDLLATARPGLAVKRNNGELFRDREHLAWADPFSRQAWNYNIAIAVEAAHLGFDEIQFDYVRFPDQRGLVFSKQNTMENRLAAITGFLSEARRQLTPYNVFLAADIFGYVIWNTDDTHIGQRLRELASAVDYISPMLYPSSFQFGIPGYPVSVSHPHEIVLRSLQHAHERTGIAPIRFRPWLQAFRDYAFDRRPFGCAAISAQIRAAEKFGTEGWMLWNPRNVYSSDDIAREEAGCGQKTAGSNLKTKPPSGPVGTQQ